MSDGAALRLYHELTAYDRDSELGVPRDDPRLRQGLVTDGVATRPWPCKPYRDGLPVVALPREWPPRAGRLFTCVGVPTYRSKGGGRPGAARCVAVPAARPTPAEDDG